MSHVKKPLVVNQHVVNDMLDNLQRLLAPHTETFSINFTTYAIQVTYIPESGAPFILPSGPIEVRVNRGRHEYI